MKRLPLFLVRTVCIRYKFAFLEFSIQFTGKMIQRVEHTCSTYKCRPNSSMPQNNVAHGGFVPGKQRVHCINIFFGLGIHGLTQECIQVLTVFPHIIWDKEG